MILVNDIFSLGLVLGTTTHITHLLWDYCEHLRESILVLSKIKQNPRLASIMTVAVIPLSVQLSPLLKPYFHVHYAKSASLKKLEELLK